MNNEKTFLVPPLRMASSALCTIYNRRFFYLNHSIYAPAHCRSWNCCPFPTCVFFSTRFCRQQRGCDGEIDIATIWVSNNLWIIKRARVKKKKGLKEKSRGGYSFSSISITHSNLFRAKVRPRVFRRRLLICTVSPLSAIFFSFSISVEISFYYSMNKR